MADETLYGDLNDEDFLQAATQFSWSQSDFAESPRPAKRRRFSDEVPTANRPNSIVKQRGAQPQSILPHDGQQISQADGSKDFLGTSDEEESDAFDPPQPTKTPPRTKHPQGKHQACTPDIGYGSKKSKASIYVPKRTEVLKESYATQAPPASNPWALRGAIWQKEPGPALSSKDNNAIPRNGNHQLDQRRYRGLNDSPQGLHDQFLEEAALSHDAAFEDDEAQLPQPMKQSAAQSGTPVIDITQELAGLPSDAFATSSPPPRSKNNEPIYVSSQSDRLAANGVRVVAPLHGLRQKTLFGDTVEQMGTQSQATKRSNWVQTRKDEQPTHHQLDQEALKSWVYPTNLGTTRDYQYNITHRGLFHNLLVALPTGLGKTFIAATVMLNWYRWTKKAQIVFVAPTKPLVSQQVEACFGIAGIPRSATTMLTGGVAPGIRAEEWNEKRVFFMTPQTIINDLKTGICDPKKIVLLVVDEAHRATGGYAYVEVIKFLRRFNQSFRVLALTATPGSTVETVQQVIDGLDIARVEIRNEHSLDIRQFVHTKDTDTVLFNFSDEQEMCMDMFSKALQPLVNQLNGFNAYWGKDPMTLTAYGLTLARTKWLSSDAGRRAGWGLKGMVNRIITILARLAHAIELLKFHGIGSFYRILVGFRDDVKGGSKYENQINEHEEFKKLMSRLRVWINDDRFIGHPKIDYLQNIVLQHFANAGDGQNATNREPRPDTRIMIFAHYRDSVEEIVRVLKRHQPMIRPHMFVGQAGSKDAEGMHQKQQLDVVEKFKNGVYNTLVATSIGEEGLDIGEVDLIVCYDSSASPIRMLQRMGRTGRKRQGNIVLLLMRGKEENSFNQAKDNYEKMQAMIANGDRFSFHEDRSPRIVPREIEPAVDKRFVDIPKENTQAELPEPKRRGRVPKRPPKKFHMPDGVRTGFVKASRLDDDDEEELGGTSSSKLQSKPESLEDVEQVLNPPLSEVILGSAQEKELGRKYTFVCGDDENITVSSPRLDAFPQHQRSLRRPIFVKHSRASKRLSQLLTSMHDLDEAKAASLGKGLHMSDVEPGSPSNDEPFESDHESYQSPPAARKAQQRQRKTPVRKKKSPAKTKRTQPPTPQPTRRRGRPRKTAATFEVDADDMDAPESSAPQSSARMRLPSQAVDLGSDDTSGEDAVEGEPSSELRDFVVDDDAEVEVDEEDEDGLGTETESLPTMSQLMGTSGERDGGGADGEDNFSEVERLVQTRITDPEMMGRRDDDDVMRQASSPRQGPKRKRHVVEDSDSD
ncbi:MAG: 3'-5' DNA helicase [Bathelium mastoideum]|nr:MAG: 3'-5' DNA helicase [Bathelium mastoideum]